MATVDQTSTNAPKRVIPYFFDSEADHSLIQEPTIDKTGESMHAADVSDHGPTWVGQLGSEYNQYGG
jgi:hypothetical protein